MALRELSSTLCRLIARDARPTTTTIAWNCRRYASSQDTSRQKTAKDLEDLESQSSFSSSGYPAENIKAYDPVKRAQGRRRELPPKSFLDTSTDRPVTIEVLSILTNLPQRQILRLESLYLVHFPILGSNKPYRSTIAPDLMAMTYVHKPPGTVTVPKAERLRKWDDTSPYHKGRPKRGPRGPGEVLRVVEKDINWRSIPKIESVVVHSMIKGAIDDSAHLHVAGIMLQAVTGVRPQVHRAKHSVSQFGIRESMPISLTCTMRGNQAYEFVDKCISLVFPRIKDWQGVKGSTGDGAGNISFGFDREGAILFPEVEVNYDMYPPKMIPGFHVTIQTSATSDRHARLLLSAMGVPFYGKLID